MPFYVLANANGSSAAATEPFTSDPPGKPIQNGIGNNIDHAHQPFLVASNQIQPMEAQQIARKIEQMQAAQQQQQQPIQQSSNEDGEQQQQQQQQQLKRQPPHTVHFQQEQQQQNSNKIACGNAAPPPTTAASSTTLIGTTGGSGYRYPPEVYASGVGQWRVVAASVENWQEMERRAIAAAQWQPSEAELMANRRGGKSPPKYGRFDEFIGGGGGGEQHGTESMMMAQPQQMYGGGGSACYWTSDEDGSGPYFLRNTYIVAQ